MSAVQPSGSLKTLPVSMLLLDWQNPRLPPAMQTPQKSQTELALYIDEHFDAVKVARSIADHQYFQSEPLIAVTHGKQYIVIEGNRRLTALMGLLQPDLRLEFIKRNKAWKKLDVSRAPTEVPVLVVPDRSLVVPLLGFRHISGIEPWSPYAQARYISRLVVEDKLELDAIAELVGRPPKEVRAMYRDLDILNQGEKAFGLDTSRARASFAVFTNAMGRRGIRTYLKAPVPSSVDPTHWPLHDSSKVHLEELMTWIFGAGPSAEGRVIQESRDLGDLASVLGDRSGRGVRLLRLTGDLADALDASENPDTQLKRAVQRARKALEAAAALEVETPTAAVSADLASILELASDLASRWGDQE